MGEKGLGHRFAEDQSAPLDCVYPGTAGGHSLKQDECLCQAARDSDQRHCWTGAAQPAFQCSECLAMQVVGGDR